MIRCTFDSSGDTVDLSRSIDLPRFQARRKNKPFKPEEQNTFEVLGPSDNNHTITPNSAKNYHFRSCVILGISPFLFAHFNPIKKY